MLMLVAVEGWKTSPATLTEASKVEAMVDAVTLEALKMTFRVESGTICGSLLPSAAKDQLELIP
jgi:hypothetical protein